MKKIAYMMVALAMVAAPMAFADSVFLGGKLDDAVNWSNGYATDSVSTIAVDGTHSANWNLSTWGTFTMNHTAGTIVNGSNYNLYNSPNGTYNQSGGSITTPANRAIFANQLTYNFSGGTDQAGNVEATNGGTFTQTGGSFTAIGSTKIYRVANNGTASLLGGSAVSTTAAAAFALDGGALNVGGDFDMVFGGALLSGAAPLTFATDWTGSFTRDDYTAADWQADLVAGTVNVGGTDITDANFATWFSVANSGAVGSALTVIPEPATLGLVAAFGGGVLFIRRRLMM